MRPSIAVSINASVRVACVEPYAAAGFGKSSIEPLSN